MIHALCLLVSMATMEDALRRLEQRLDEQASEIVALRSKVAFLQDDGKAGTDKLFVTLDGRLLSHESAVAVCCRWTPDSTCGAAVEADLYRTCTGLHEYLEAKTTTYEFADVANAQCLGPTSSNWKWEYNGHHGNVTLKSGATVVAGFKTPLKVMLAQNCADPPSLVVQMDTTMTGSLNVAGLNVGNTLSTLSPLSTRARYLSGTDAACGKSPTIASCTASTVYSAAYPCTNAFDGTTSTDWASIGNDNAWIKLTFAAASTIDTMHYFNRAPADSAKHVLLEFSDGTNATARYIAYNEYDGYPHRFPAVTTTYVKITIQAVWLATNVGAAEIDFSMTCG